MTKMGSVPVYYDSNLGLITVYKKMTILTNTYYILSLLED